ncbi:hypothetical protein HP397_04385 [Streptobacillus felis]|uniref:Uncharacterized protein n=1 Tax=Streptobacillus felis TaxID=1384509 RepID=A0A7Z0PGY2_9FUSO|nr:hypothetical protein [Streptobacillus felis]NYV28050.1 hypothetical protein [Streptobacillus felis]
MKKFLMAILFGFTMFSCTMLNVTDYRVPNSEIRANLAQKVDNRIDLFLAKGEITIRDVYVKDYRLNIILSAETSSVVGALFGKTSQTAIVHLESDIRVQDGKIYTKNVRVKEVKGNIQDEVIKQITNAVVYATLDNTEIYSYRYPKDVKSAYLGENSIIINFR